MYLFCIKLFIIFIFGSCIAKAYEEEVAPTARPLLVAEEDSVGPAVRALARARE
jgi:hypothetical protein